MSPIQISKLLIVAALMAYCWSNQEAEARGGIAPMTPMTSQQQATAAMANMVAGGQVSGAEQQQLMNAALNNLADSDGDDDDNDNEEDKSNLQLQNPLMASGTDIYQDQSNRAGNMMMMDQSYPNKQYQAAVPSAANDLQTQASHHHHGHGAKGWLDMGAWTGKKGSFGWYDKHPVGGKGKK